MSSVSMSTPLGAPAAAVWGTIRDFNAFSKFLPLIATSTMNGSGVGAVRNLTLQDGAEVAERLESFDENQRTLSYRILSAPLPLENYIATMRVEDRPNGRCELQWSSTFEPKGAPEADVKALIEGIYAAGFDGLKKLHGA